MDEEAELFEIECQMVKLPEFSVLKNSDSEFKDGRYLTSCYWDVKGFGHRKIQKLTKKKVRINFKERRKGDIVEIVANVDKLKRFLTWKPKFNNLIKIVKSSIDWEKELN